jgi:hypothetical protein
MFPLLLIPVAAYNALAALGAPIATPILSSKIALSLEDLLVMVTLILLTVEVWRSAAPTPAAARNHVASLLVLLACISETGVVPWCRTGTFLIIVTAVACDLTVGTYISFVTKGRNVLVSGR